MNLNEYLDFTKNWDFRKEHALTEKGVWMIHSHCFDDYQDTRLGMVTGTLEEAIKRALKIEGFIYAETYTVYPGDIRKARSFEIEDAINYKAEVKELDEKIAELKKTKLAIIKAGKEVEAFLKKA